VDSHERAGTSLVLAGVAAFMGIVTASALSPDYSIRQDISDLGSTRPPDPVVVEPSATLFNATMLATGALVLLAAVALWRGRGPRPLAGGLAVFGTAVFAVGVFPGNVTPWHGIAAFVTFLSGSVTARYVDRPLSHLSLLLGGVSLAVLASVFVYGLALRAPSPLAPLGPGGVERWVAYPPLFWLLVFGGHLAGGGVAE
jgi:hypothetical membrane protein